MKGHIRRRGDDSWAVVIYLGKDAAGKDRYRWYSVKGTKKQAEAKLAELLSSMNQGGYVEPSRLTVAEYLKKWLAEAVEPSVKPKTHQWYKMIVDRHLAPALGRIPLSKLKPLDLQGYFTKALTSGRYVDGEPGKGALSPASVRGQYRVIHRALEQAVKWGLVARNVADAVDPPRVPRREMKTLHRDQVLALLEKSKPTGHYALYLAAVTTGMRQGELLALRWSDVDLDARTASVQRTLKKAGLNPEFDAPKTSKGIRSVALPAELAEALRRQKAEQAEQRLKAGDRWQDFGLLFTTRLGRPISPRNLDREFKELLEAAGLPKEIRFHDLRHTHATLLLGQGVHLKVVSERLGHSSVSITGDIYSHVLPTMQQQAAALLDEALFGNRKPAKKKGKKPRKTQGSQLGLCKSICKAFAERKRQ
ncbi:MAG: site-specific integrase [Bacillota bacterium]|nr:site-specific integrase [Bacillota bacterium]